MSDQRTKIFRLIETADNFVKYSQPGRADRGARRARKRLEKAQDLAVAAGDLEMQEQIRLRLEDLERRAALPDDATGPDVTGPDNADSLTAALPEHAAARVPPGQRLKKGWPVLHEGPVPKFDTRTWRLSVNGLVGRSLELTYEELKALPSTEMTSDFHCVTGWSKLDNLWRGVQTKVLMDMAQPGAGARHVTVHAEYGYTANLPLDVLMEDTSMVTWSHNGADLAPKHGYPLRLIVPRLYAWKSVKWVRSFELLDEDRRGFWEVRGYHNRADPWLEERYSYQEGNKQES
ncbi:MAG: sulfite oxidase-like oxidoreductase [Actinomycetota bacterium]